MAKKQQTKSKYMRTFVLILSLTIFLFQMSFVQAQTFQKIDRIVIDAGHGGKDPGTIGKHSYEKDVALAIALKVGKYIQQNLPDVEVIYTRKTDVFIELYRRAQIANEKKADVFISIHCNAVGSRSPHGTETFIIGATKSERNLAVAKKENASILYESDYEKRYNNFDPNSPESYIIFELFQNAFREQSMDLATLVQDQFTNSLQRNNRGVKEAGFLVLVNTTMPSILVETGFLSNPEEEKYLMSESGQNEIASAIYRAFKAYKLKMEKINRDAAAAAAAEKKRQDSIARAVQEAKKPVIAVDSMETDKVIFGVQFLTSKQHFSKGSDRLKGMKDVWLYEDNGYYKYVSGKYRSFDKANAHARAVRANGFADAFVVAFYKGKRIPKRKALKMTE